MAQFWKFTWQKFWFWAMRTTSIIPTATRSFCAAEYNIPILDTILERQRFLLSEDGTVRSSISLTWTKLFPHVLHATNLPWRLSAWCRRERKRWKWSCLVCSTSTLSRLSRLVTDTSNLSKEFRVQELIISPSDETFIADAHRRFVSSKLLVFSCYGETFSIQGTKLWRPRYTVTDFLGAGATSFSG